MEAIQPDRSGPYMIYEVPEPPRKTWVCYRHGTILWRSRPCPGCVAS